MLCRSLSLEHYYLYQFITKKTLCYFDKITFPLIFIDSYYLQYMLLVSWETLSAMSKHLFNWLLRVQFTAKPIQKCECFPNLCTARSQKTCLTLNIHLWIQVSLHVIVLVTQWYLIYWLNLLVGVRLFQLDIMPGNLPRMSTSPICLKLT